MMGLVVSPGDLTKVPLQLLKQHPVSERLLWRAERVDVGEVGKTGQNVGLMGHIAVLNFLVIWVWKSMQRPNEQQQRLSNWSESGINRACCTNDNHLPARHHLGRRVELHGA